jgi:hypothetical protein
MAPPCFSPVRIGVFTHYKEHISMFSKRNRWFLGLFAFVMLSIPLIYLLGNPPVYSSVSAFGPESTPTVSFVTPQPTPMGGYPDHFHERSTSQNLEIGTVIGKLVFNSASGATTTPDLFYTEERLFYGLNFTSSDVEQVSVTVELNNGDRYFMPEVDAMAITDDKSQLALGVIDASTEEVYDQLWLVSLTTGEITLGMSYGWDGPYIYSLDYMPTGQLTMVKGMAEYTDMELGMIQKPGEFTFISAVGQPTILWVIFDGMTAPLLLDRWELPTTVTVLDNWEIVAGDGSYRLSITNFDNPEEVSEVQAALFAFTR